MNEIPEICSELQWDQVRLPPSISEADLDGVLFSVLTRWPQKMAMVLGKAIGRCKELGWPISKDVLGARIQVLAEAGHIESFGDLRMWRFSEVRLRD
jgi:hypothetical protein